MLKEPQDIDFYTSGRQLSDDDFQSISQWIAADKQKRADTRKTSLKEQIMLVRYIRGGRVVRRVRQG